MRAEDTLWKKKRISEEELKEGCGGGGRRANPQDRRFYKSEKLYGELIASVKKYHPSDDISLIEKAYRVAADAHKDQKEKEGGEPYIIHPLCVAFGVSWQIWARQESIAAGLLRRYRRNTVLTEEEAAEEFGGGVLIVSGV